MCNFIVVPAPRIASLSDTRLVNLDLVHHVIVDSNDKTRLVFVFNDSETEYVETNFASEVERSAIIDKIVQNNH